MSTAITPLTAARVARIGRQHARPDTAAETAADTSAANLARYRQSTPPAPPFARALPWAMSLALAAGAIVVGLDVFAWRV